MEQTGSNIARISYEQFKELEIRIGEIRSAERVPETDKLLKLSVDMGEPEPRTIVSGIAEYFPEPEALVGVKCAFAANIAPRTIRGIESNGMILAALSPEGAFSTLRVSEDIPAGIRIS